MFSFRTWKSWGVIKEDIDTIVISHDHWDYLGKVEATGPKNIAHNVYITGEMGDKIKEQAILNALSFHSIQR